MERKRFDCLVTGGNGFLGSWLCRSLVARGKSVLATYRKTPLAIPGVEWIQLELSQAEPGHFAAYEFDRVVHCAALSGPWGTRRDFYRCNVKATEGLVKALRQHRLKRFVHISTASVYVSKTPQIQVRETDPLPPQFMNLYAETKRLAEKIVLSERASQGLPAILLRPQGIIGDGDPSIFPRILRVAQKGVLPVIGTGDTKIDLTYVDNVVEAIHLALEAPEKFEGHIYNVTNDEPLPLYDTFRYVLSRLDYKVRERRLPLPIAWKLATGLESLHSTFRILGEPTLTRYSTSVLGVSRILSVEAIKRDLGYRPVVPIREGLDRFIESLKHD